MVKCTSIYIIEETEYAICLVIKFQEVLFCFLQLSFIMPVVLLVILLHLFQICIRYIHFSFYEKSKLIN